MPEVLRRVPRARLLLAGGGDMEDELKRQVLDLGLRRAVTFLGTRDDAPLLLQAFDVLALPSLWEGLPMVVLEAMAAGCPVVASAVGGLPDVIEDRVSGRLVPPADPAALAFALADLLSSDEERSALAVAARARFDAHYSARFMVHSYEKLYRRQHA
jgi:glycosyltransferase involved in cell wall biosynthesis